MHSEEVLSTGVLKQQVNCEPVNSKNINNLETKKAKTLSKEMVSLNVLKLLFVLELHFHSSENQELSVNFQKNLKQG